ncbi:MAG TPA: hypothetical protein PLP21_09550 [Pyrinomonadaceae bacterium]|nr:PD40 domain-containing protein [Acidobacteriota bacterium]HQZ96551.1 hypothetical protein [Pyrinomonadaceae bacterium]
MLKHIRSHKTILIYTLAAGIICLAAFAIPVSWLHIAASSAGTVLQPADDAVLSPTAPNGRIFYSDGQNASSSIISFLPGGNPGGAGTNLGRGFQPAVSPDGTKVAFVDNTAGAVANGGPIMLMNPDGTNRRALPNPAAGFTPAWSPDGNRLAYVVGNDSGGSGGSGEIWVMDLTPGFVGTNPVKIPNTRNAQAPHWGVNNFLVWWSRDGVFGIAKLGPVPPTSQIATGSPLPTRLPGVQTFDVEPVWSPDATKIAFNSVRDYPSGGGSEIYTMDANGGSQTRVTNIAGSKASPTWAPDGTAIAFEHDFVLKKVNPNGSDGGNPPSVQTSGFIYNRLHWAAGAVNSRVIRAVDVSGTGPQVDVSFELNSLGDEAGISFSVNFDPTKLSNPVATIGSGAPSGAVVGTNASQALIGKVGVLLDSTTAFTAGNRQMFTLKFNVASGAAPGASTITFGNTPTVQSVTTPLGAPLTTTYQAGIVNITAATVTNGKIAYQQGGRASSSIYTITPGSGISTGLRRGFHPAYSPDGTTIAFTDNTAGPTDGFLMLMNANGTNVRQLATPRQGFTPTWSPDGTRLAFVRGDFNSVGDNGKGQIYVVDMTPGSEGANEVLIQTGTRSISKPAWGSTNRIVAACYDPSQFGTDPKGVCVTGPIPASQDIAANPPTFALISGQNTNDREATWSPDGSRVAFISTRDYPMFNASEIYSANPDGSSPTRLSNTVDFKSQPTWSPDGTKIAYSRGGSQGSTNAVLRSVNADGSNAATPAIITNFGSGDVFPNWGSAPPAQADVRITSIGDTPDPAVLNQRVFYQVQLFNAGPAAATGVRLTTDPLPASVDFSNQSPSYCAFGGDRVVTCTLPNGLGTTGLDNSLRVDIAVIPRQLGTIDFRARVTANQQDTNLTNNEATATTSVVPSSDLSLDVTGPTQATIDSNVVYQMLVTNNGPDSALGARAEFNMPTGVDFVSAEPSVFSCIPTSISGGTKVTCNLGTVTLGTLSTIPRITVKPRVLGPILVGGQVFVTGSSDTVPGNDADSVSTVIVDVPRADLGITVAYSPNVLNNTVRVGDQYSQYFTVRNFGPAAATNVTIIFTTAAGATAVPNLTDPRCASTTNGEGATLYVCSLGNLANGATVDFVGITVTALTAGTRHDTASVTANEPEPTGTTGNNTVTTNVSVLGGLVDLEMIADFPPQIFLGDNATITVRVRNNGPSSASNVRIQIQRFSGTFFVSVSSPSCTETLGVLTCPLGNLAAGQSSEILTAAFLPASQGNMQLALSTDSSTQEQSPDPHPNSGNINVPVLPRVEFLGMEVTQGVQDLSNSIPVIKGKQTYVRAYIKTQGSASVTPELTGRRTSGGGSALLGTLPLSNSGRTSISTSADPDRDSFENNPYFLIPETWRDGTVVFELSLKGNPGPLICSDVDGVGDCKSTVTFRNPVTLPVEFIRMTYTSGTTNYSPSKEQRQLATDQIDSIFPVTSITWNETYMTIDPSVSGFPCRASTDLTRILNLVAGKRALDCPSGQCTKRYLGLVAPSALPTGATNCNGGIAFSPGFAGMSFVYPITSNGELNPAHELGHSLSLQHTAYTLSPGGTAAGPGPHDPPDGTISVKKDDFDKDTVYGFDVWNLNRYDTSPTPGTQRVFGPNTPNFMSYANARKWVSELDYKRLLFYLEGDGAIATTRPTEADRIEVDDIVLVSGLVPLLAGGTAELSPIYTVTSPRAIVLPTSGPYELRFEGSQGQSLASYNFEPERGSDGIGSLTGSFTFVLPRIPGTTRVSVWNNGQLITARQSSPSAPQVAVVSPNGGETLSGATANINWTATDADPGTTLSYILQFSPDGGTTWQTIVNDWRSTTYALDLRNLRATTQGIVRVLASDGFTTSQDQSNSTFTVTQHAPEAEIRSPRSNASIVGEQTLLLEGEAYDVEDGLLADAGLTWNSNRNGDLGTGRSLAVSALTLQEGTHTITLTGRDSNGQTGTATITLVVSRVAPVLPPSLSLNLSQAFFSAFAGSVPTTPQTVTITNSGSGTLSWNASADQEWIKLGSQSGTAPSNLDVRVDPTGLAIGTYSGKITITGQGVANSPQIVNVFLAVVQAPPATVTGRVLTPSGLGLRNVVVSLIAESGVRRVASTSSFGLFSFANVPSGATYTISVASKRYRFAPRIVTVNGDANLGDLVGLE